ENHLPKNPRVCPKRLVTLVVYWGAGGPAFEFADAIITVGAPSFAQFAKGGYSTAVSESARVCHTARSWNETSAHPTSTRPAAFFRRIEAVTAPSTLFWGFHHFPYQRIDPRRFGPM